MRPRSDIEIKSLNFRIRKNEARILILLLRCMSLDRLSKGWERPFPACRKRGLILHRANMRMKYEKACRELGTMLVRSVCQLVVAWLLLLPSLLSCSATWASAQGNVAKGHREKCVWSRRNAFVPPSYHCLVQLLARDAPGKEIYCFKASKGLAVTSLHLLQSPRGFQLIVRSPNC